MMGTKRVWLYARSATGDIEAIESQINRLTAFAEQEGYEVIGISHENGSGNTLDRPELNKIKALRRNKIDALLVTDLSRIGRNVLGVFGFEKFLYYNGVEILTLIKNKDVWFMEMLQETFKNYFKEKHFEN